MPLSDLNRAAASVPILRNLSLVARVSSALRDGQANGGGRAVGVARPARRSRIEK